MPDSKSPNDSASSGQAQQQSGPLTASNLSQVPHESMFATWLNDPTPSTTYERHLLDTNKAPTNGEGETHVKAAEANVCCQLIMVWVNQFLMVSTIERPDE